MKNIQFYVLFNELKHIRAQHLAATALGRRYRGTGGNDLSFVMNLFPILRRITSAGTSLQSVHFLTNSAYCSIRATDSSS